MNDSGIDDPNDAAIGPFYCDFCAVELHKWCDSLLCGCNDDEHFEGGSNEQEDQ